MEQGDVTTEKGSREGDVHLYEKLMPFCSTLCLYVCMCLCVIVNSKT